MANANTEINIDQLHQVIETAISTQFPTLVTVEFDSDERTLPAMPACLLEISEAERFEEQDPGTGQLPVTLRFAARLAIGFRTPNAKREIKKLAFAFAAWLHLRTWRAQGCPSGPAQVVGAYRDDFSPELDQFMVWRVEWAQEIHLGQTVWTDGTPITDFAVRTDVVPHYQNGPDSSTPVADGTHHPIDEYVDLTP